MRKIEISQDYQVNIDGTSDGNQDKYYKDGLWYKVDHHGCEGRNEEIVARFLSCSSLKSDNYVDYEAILINGEHGCVSRDFTREGEQVISIYRLSPPCY